MKLEGLAIIFIIIILPISLVIQIYTNAKVETINLQTQYDTKLLGATYDALKAYQINSASDDLSNNTNVKMQEINASIKSFYNSLALSLTTEGLTKNTLKNYIPSVVFTQYDGYYIYSPYTNTWDQKAIQNDNSSTYENGAKEYGIKPYVYYSCRYLREGDFDVVISYTLDNYVTIEGVVNNNPVHLSGYLLSNVEENGDIVKYNETEITEENVLKENVVLNKGGETVVENLPYIKENGIKNFCYTSNNETIKINNKEYKNVVFSYMNDSIIVRAYQNSQEDSFKWDTWSSKFDKNNQAVNYYKEALELKNKLSSPEYKVLGEITYRDAVDSEGNPLINRNNNDKAKTVIQELKDQDGYIFDFNHPGGIEARDSNFNSHRFDIIKYSIESNLSVVISNYNQYSADSNVNFKMPQLKDTDWDKIMDNISIISFMQGLNIGNKIYNGYSIVTNTKNQDVVTEESIFIKGSDDYLHRPTEKNLGSWFDEYSIGIYNIDAEKRISYNTEDGEGIEYYPVSNYYSYDSIINQSNVVEKSISEYMREQETDSNLKKIYYTALARERYGLYRFKIGK